MCVRLLVCGAMSQCCMRVFGVTHGVGESCREYMRGSTVVACPRSWGHHHTPGLHAYRGRHSSSEGVTGASGLYRCLYGTERWVASQGTSGCLFEQYIVRARVGLVVRRALRRCSWYAPGAVISSLPEVRGWDRIPLRPCPPVTCVHGVLDVWPCRTHHEVKENDMGSPAVHY